MLERAIRWSIARPLLVAFAALALFALGLLWVQGLPVEVFPALAPAETVVQTEAPGLVAEQVEQLVTRPVENALGGIPGVTAVRSDSAQGLSVIILVAGSGAKPGAVRALAVERLAQAAAALPAGIGTPRIAPLAAPGALLRIGFTSDKLDPMALRNVIQWTVRPRLLAASGVANVALYGGQTRRIEVRARPGDLSDSDLGFLDVLDAVRRATSVAGAGFMDTPEQRVMIDPRGQALTAKDVEAGQIQQPGNAPTRIGDVADVVDAPAPVTGDALIMGKPGVLADVTAIYGGKTVQTTHAVEQALDLLRPALDAQGVTVTADLDRPADFLVGSMRRLAADLIIGGALIAVMLLVALRDPRAVLACLLAIPLPLLAALVALKALGLTLNAMTLGGLFVALGVVIDDAVIDVEAVVSRLRSAEAHQAAPAEAVLAALLEVRAPVVYATLLLDIALLPLLFVKGAFGALIGPLVLTTVVATLASVAVTAWLTPVLAVLLLQHLKPRPETRLVHRVRGRYAAWLQHHCARPGWAVLAVGLAAVATAALLTVLPRAPLPSFHDQHLTVQIKAPAATSPDAMRRIGQALTRTALAISGVDHASMRAGRDPTEFSAWAPDQGEMQLALAQNLNAEGQDRTADRLKAAFAGYPDVAAQVSARLGVRPSSEGPAAPFAVNVYGENLEDIAAAADHVAAVLKGVPGSGEVRSRTGEAAPAMRVDLDFKRLALYGLSAADVLTTVQTALVGRVVAQVYENGRAFDLAVSGPETLRRDPEAIGDLLLRSSSGVSVPLKRVANVYLTEGRTLIQHEAGQRYERVTASPAAAGAGRFAVRAEAAIRAKAALPAGVYLTYDVAGSGGAEDRRALLVGGGLAVLAMIALLFAEFRDGRLAAVILVSTAFAFLGGAVAAALFGGVISLGSIAGFLALFGLSTRSAILLTARPHAAAARHAEGWTRTAVAAAGAQRAPPILLTTALVALALSPLLFTGGEAGGELLTAMAVVLIGGLISGAALTLMFLPALVYAYVPPRKARAT